MITLRVETPLQHVAFDDQRVRNDAVLRTLRDGSDIDQQCSLLLIVKRFRDCVALNISSGLVEQRVHAALARVFRLYHHDSDSSLRVARNIPLGLTALAPG